MDDLHLDGWDNLKSRYEYGSLNIAKELRNIFNCNRDNLKLRF